MKISKLFHWLYGLIMLLPIFAIGTTCLISTFNMSSKEESEIIYKYETNEVNSANDLIEGRIYHYEIDLTQIENIGFLQCYNIYNLNSSSDIDFTFNSEAYFQVNKSSNDTVAVRYNNEYTESFVYRLQDNKFIADVIFKSLISVDNYLNYSISTFNVIDHIETHNLETQDVFYNAVDKVRTSPLFSWAYNSFLAQPLVYICTLFSLPSNSVIVQLLSYWLAISIIWLVFDLVMYIPLLVHRWLDKGVLE